MNRNYYKNDIILEAQIGNVVRQVMNKFLGKVNLNDGIHELTEQDDIANYSKKIWQILQRSYAQIGGFKSYESLDEMAERTSLAILCVDHGKIVACAIYRDDLGGFKMNGCGTIDGSPRSKQLLRSVVKDDIENIQKYHWVEVSYPLEGWFKEEGGNPIPSALAAKLLHKSNSKITPLSDGVHYQREVGKEKKIMTKAIYGFNKESTYNKVMSKLEEYTGFNDYDEFKAHINSLPKIQEDIDYTDNHPNKEIAIAMEVIIQIGNAWDDGFRELTPKMQQYLVNALRTLSAYPEKNRQIVSLIKNGNYYYNHMDIMECHTDSNYDYLLFPLT